MDWGAGWGVKYKLRVFTRHLHDPHIRQSSLFCNEQTIAATFALLSFNPLEVPLVDGDPLTPVLFDSFCLSTVNWIAFAAGFVLK